MCLPTHPTPPHRIPPAISVCLCHAPLPLSHEHPNSERTPQAVPGSPTCLRRRPDSPPPPHTHLPALLQPGKGSAQSKKGWPAVPAPPATFGLPVGRRAASSLNFCAKLPRLCSSGSSHASPPAGPARCIGRGASGRTKGTPITCQARTLPQHQVKAGKAAGSSLPGVSYGAGMEDTLEELAEGLQDSFGLRSR